MREAIFGKVPDIKGAIIGDLGNRVWVLWKHRFDGTPGDKEAANTLYILVVENRTVLRSFSTVPAQLVALREEQELLVRYVRLCRDMGPISSSPKLDTASPDST